MLRTLVIASAAVLLASCAASSPASQAWTPPEWSGPVVIFADQALNCPDRAPPTFSYYNARRGTALAVGYAKVSLESADDNGVSVVFAAPTMNGETVRMHIGDGGVGRTTIGGEGFFAGQRVELLAIADSWAERFHLSGQFITAPMTFFGEVQDQAGRCLYRFMLAGSQTRAEPAKIPEPIPRGSVRGDRF